MVLLFCGGLSLSAQSRTSASIYVSPVTGTGSKPEDNTLFYNQLVIELTDQNYVMVMAQDGADFSLVGTLVQTDEGEFSFHLELQDNKIGETTVEGELLYETVDDINSQFPVLVSTLLYTIPDDPIPKAGTGINDEWRNKWLYVGASAIWSPRIYTGTETSTNLLSIGGGISAEFHVLNFLSLEAGLEFAQDMVKINDKDEMCSLLEIPLLIKGVFKPGKWFMLEPYAGVQLNIPFESTTKAPATFLAGLQYGVKAGPGTFFVNARFGMDIGDFNVEATSDHDGFSFKRTTIHVGVGYKFGLINRKTK